MWLQLSQILKKFTEGNARKLAFIFTHDVTKKQKNTRGITRGHSFKRALMPRHVLHGRKQE